MKLKNIQDKFEDREIQPSIHTWDKLSQRLDQEDKKKKKPVLFWVAAVAAILVLGLLIIPSLLMQEVVKENNQQLVIEEPVQEVEETTLPERDVMIDQNAESIADVEVENDPVKNQSQTITTSLALKTVPATPTGIALEEPTRENNEVLNANSTVTMQTSNPMAGIEQALSGETTDELSEADRLLNQAMLQIKKKRAVDVAAVATSKKLDPGKLLRETEWDLEYQRQRRLENSLLDGLGRLKREAVVFLEGEQ